MEAQSFALLCALAAISCNASATSLRQAWFWLAGLLSGVVLIHPGWLGLPLTPLLAIEPAQVSLLLFLLAFVRIKGSLSVPLLLFSGGVLAVIWLQTLTSLGYPLPAALVLVLAGSLAALLCSLYRPRFSSAELLEEAFLIVLVFALAQALVPEVLKGWVAAVGLQSVGDGEPAASTDARILLVAAGFALLGALYAKYRHSKGYGK